KPQRGLRRPRRRRGGTGKGQQRFRGGKGSAGVFLTFRQARQFLPGLQIPQGQTPFVTGAYREPVAVRRGRQRDYLTGLLAKGKQCVTAGLLPEIAPFPAAQILLAWRWALPVEEFQRPAKIVSRQCLGSDIHVRGVSPLTGSEFFGFGVMPCCQGFAGGVRGPD